MFPLGYRLSPDGAYVVFSNTKGIELNTQQALFDLMLLKLSTGETRVLAADVKQSYGVAWGWSPDSKSIVYTTPGRPPQAIATWSRSRAERPSMSPPGKHPVAR